MCFCVWVCEAVCVCVRLCVCLTEVVLVKVKVNIISSHNDRNSGSETEVGNNQNYT